LCPFYLSLADRLNQSYLYVTVTNLSKRHAKSEGYDENGKAGVLPVISHAGDGWRNCAEYKFVPCVLPVDSHSASNCRVI
jgi:hypothetical protein